MLSLFDRKSTSETFSTRTKSEEYLEYVSKISDFESVEMISPSEPVEIVIYIDYPDNIRPEHETTIDYIVKFYERMKKMSISNLSIRLVRGTSNVRISIARNALIQLSSGDYILFRDDDDVSTNVNNLLHIINDSISKNNGVPPLFIEGFLMNLNKSWTSVPITSLWSACGCIVSRKFLILNNLAFPNVKGFEDVIWRSNIYQKLMTIPKPTTSGLEVLRYESFYLYCEASNSSMLTTIDPFAESIDKYSPSDMDSNDTAYINVSRMFERVVSTFGNIRVNGNLFRGINIGSAIKHGYPLIKTYLLKNMSKCDEHLREYMELISKVRGSMKFGSIEKKYQQECFETCLYYMSFSDLYAFAKQLCSTKHITSTEAIIETMNVLFCRQDAFKTIESRFKFRFKNISFQPLDEFTYNYMSYLYMKGDIDRKAMIDRYKFDWKHLETLDSIRHCIDRVSRFSLDGELLLFLHGNFSRKIKGTTNDPKYHCLHDVMNYIGKYVDDKLLRHMSNDNNDYIRIGMSQYRTLNDLWKFKLLQKWMPGTCLEVLISLFVSPMPLDGSIKNFDVEENKYEKFDVIEIKDSNVKRTLDKHMFDSEKPFLSGGMLTSVDGNRNIFIVLLIVGGIVVIVLIAIVVTFVVKKRSTHSVS